ncbi:uncharacterized protein (TIGR03085 family) [Motilibacter peucedani]|uniref:Uncharacterized protein (TIGR03085 family) n=1 Tax=Motilibacter peucedani TaxID=598650 RepID=A0A420XVD0_9ACTN|nr:TIGR03085 family metal-binding protein [Motilibacter peucedani]RKS84256.1 uncharacterized protein (TIGR03085 family) [Motilibacter peucedani]
MTTYARDERAALASTLLDVGPAAPTLDEGWAARDLAAHVVLREGRPDLAAGVFVAALAGRTERAQAELAHGDWDELVARVRCGPPRWSPLGWGPVHEQVNLLELFVHHEDVRRGGAGWSPRELPAGMEQALWVQLRRAAPVLTRSTPTALVLSRTPGHDEVRLHARRGRTTTVRGLVPELVLWVFGRVAAARVEVSGDADTVGAAEDALGV